MARSYLGRRKNAAMLSIEGFEEFIQLLETVEKQGIDQAAKKAFNDASADLSSTLREKAADSRVPNHLINSISDRKVITPNRYVYNIGWRRRDPDTFMKVCWLNYGTPPRHSSKGYRGKVEPRYFITNTKRAVKRKFKARMKRMQKEILSELKK